MSEHGKFCVCHECEAAVLNAPVPEDLRREFIVELEGERRKAEQVAQYGAPAPRFWATQFLRALDLLRGAS